MKRLFLVFPQEWEEKAAEDKKRYEAEMEKWKAEGGLEQLKAAKKAAKKEERLAQAGTSGGSPKKAKATRSKAKAPASGPAASSIKSKEFIEDSDSGKKRMGICSTGVGFIAPSHDS